MKSSFHSLLPEDTELSPAFFPVAHQWQGAGCRQLHNEHETQERTHTPTPLSSRGIFSPSGAGR